MPPNQQASVFPYGARMLFTSIAVAFAMAAHDAAAADLVGKVSRRGAAREGVKITLASDDDQDFEPKTTTTTASGEFAFTRIPPGNYLLNCDADNAKSIPNKIEINPGINRRNCR